MSSEDRAAAKDPCVQCGQGKQQKCEFCGKMEGSSGHKVSREGESIARRDMHGSSGTETVRIEMGLDMWSCAVIVVQGKRANVVASVESGRSC